MRVASLNLGQIAHRFTWLEGHILLANQFITVLDLSSQLLVFRVLVGIASAKVGASTRQVHTLILAFPQGPRCEIPWSRDHCTLFISPRYIANKHSDELCVGKNIHFFLTKKLVSPIAILPGYENKPKRCLQAIERCCVIKEIKLLLWDCERFLEEVLSHFFSLFVCFHFLISNLNSKEAN